MKKGEELICGVKLAYVGVHDNEHKVSDIDASVL